MERDYRILVVDDDPAIVNIVQTCLEQDGYQVRSAGDGNTACALAVMEKVFTEEGIEVETVQVGKQVVRGCVACYGCGKLGACVYDDMVNEVAPKFVEADGLVVGSPVYYASSNATLDALLDRLFLSC